MPSKIRSIFSCGLIAVCFAVSVVQAQRQPVSRATAAIDAYAKSVDAFVKRNGRLNIVIADASEYGSDKPLWKRFKSEQELEKSRETSETYTIAYNFRKNGRIVASNFTMFSPSGDWTQYTFHYFREDGSLAKVRSELRTFYGEFTVIRDLYFDGKGGEIKRTVKYLDLVTNKPKKLGTEYKDAFNDFVTDDRYYKSTSRLPFTDLWNGK